MSIAYAIKTRNSKNGVSPGKVADNQSRTQSKAGAAVAIKLGFSLTNAVLNR